MKLLRKILSYSLLILSPLSSFAQNQTDTLSPVYSEDLLPFTLEISLAPFTLPTGLQSYASAIYQDYWIFIGGRTNGLHDFSNVGNNFPPQFQNTTVYVVHSKTGKSFSRALTDITSGLSQEEIDALSVTASQSCQRGSTLFLVGGYGIDTATQEMGTKNTLTVINLKKLMSWVIHGKPSLVKAIKQTSHPLLQVTGGFLYKNSAHDPFLLMLGQNFQGLYVPSSNGIYTEQIRPFRIKYHDKKLEIIPKGSNETFVDYRRRDLNIAPIIHNGKSLYTAFAGVFTVSGGVWTVPITIFPDGSSFEVNPIDLASFKQAMNQYNCPSFGLYSKKSKDMFVILPGGISFGYFAGNVFQTDSEIPFINQVTAIKIDSDSNYSQYLMNGEYPFIASTGSNPGNQLLFGAEAEFFPVSHLSCYDNGVIKIDKIPTGKSIHIGYIAGGIMSTLPNTNGPSDSTASPYVFKVNLIKK